MRRAYKHFNYQIGYLILPNGSQILFEFDIPSIVSGENDLQKLVDKKECVMLNQVREGGYPPVVRIIRQIYPYTSIEAADGFLKKMTRTLKVANIPINRKHVAIILPGPLDYSNERARRGCDSYTVTGDFERKDGQSFDLLEYAPSIAKASSNGAEIMLYRDKTTLENEWKIKIKFNSIHFTSRYLELCCEEFVSNTAKILNAKNFQYRLGIIT